MTNSGLRLSIRKLNLEAIKVGANDIVYTNNFCDFDTHIDNLCIEILYEIEWDLTIAWGVRILLHDGAKDLMELE